MGPLISTTSMTIDGVIDVDDWFVAQGDHDGPSRALFESDGAAMLVAQELAEDDPDQNGKGKEIAERFFSVPAPREYGVDCR